MTPDVSHQCLEPRTAMAYWQNGKLYLHTGTQSTFQTVPAIARWMNMDAGQGGASSANTRAADSAARSPARVTMIIPAMLSKKLNAPVMMRISREEEHFIGRARPSVDGAREGRLCQGRPDHGGRHVTRCPTAGPMTRSGDGGSCGDGLCRCSISRRPCAGAACTVMTNTPPRSAQSAPGGMQGIAIMEPILAKAARKLGVDQVALRRVNCPEGKAEYGPPNHEGKRAYATSCFLKQALDRGAEQFKWKERVAQPKRIGTKARGVGVSLSCLRRRHASDSTG